MQYRWLLSIFCFLPPAPASCPSPRLRVSASPRQQTVCFSSLVITSVPDIIIVGISRTPAARKLRRCAALCRCAVGFGLFELCAFALNVSTAREVLLAVEEDFAGNEGGLDARIDGERVAVPDHHVRVLADINRADALLDAELPSRIHRDRLQRF